MVLKICYKAIVVSAFNLQRKLYAVFFNPLRMIHQIGEPVHVVPQVNGPDPGLRSFEPDAPDPSTYQKADPAKDVFNPRSNRRFLFVHRLLKGRQGMVSVPLAMDMILNTSLFQNISNLLRRICAIPPHGLTGIGGIKQGFKLLAVMDMGRRYLILPYQLMLDVYIDMVLIPIMRFISLFRPASINIFLPQLCHPFFPLSRNFAILDLPILLNRVALPGHFHNTGMHNHPLFRLIAGIIQKPAKQGKELLDRPRTSYSLTKQPDGLFVGYRIFRTYPDKPSKRKTIYQLKLGLGIGEVVYVLQDHDLKHHDVIKRRSAGIALSRLAKGLGDYRLKLLPVNGLSKSLQGVSKLAQRLQFLLNIKKSKLAHVASSGCSIFHLAHHWS